MLNRMRRREQHPDDSVLQAYLDCELTENQQAATRDHLNACWTCRARLKKLEDTISVFIDFCDRAFSAESAQPPLGFRDFPTRLSRVLDEPVKVPFWYGALATVRQYCRNISELRLASGLVYTAAMAVVVVAITASLLLMGRKKDAIPPAATILAQSAWQETIDRSQVQRRTLLVEQKDVSTGRVVRRRRVESWKSGNGPRARRVYDENNALVGGNWVKPDGSHVQYRSKKRHLVPESEEKLPDGQSVWELSPLASDFGRLVGSGAHLSVKATPAVYIVGYSSTSTARPGVRSASLTLRRRDLHAVAQVLVIEGASTSSEYRIEEIGYERRTLQAADYRYFEPDFDVQPEATRLKPAPLPPVVRATLDQELQLFSRLDSVGALVGEQIDVSRLPSGGLRLNGLVATADRRNEILRALGGLAQSPAVAVQLSTFEEAQQRDRPATPAKIRLDQVEITETTFPAESALRSYLEKSGVRNRDLSEEVYRISTATLEHVSVAREHALALRRIASLFTPGEVSEFDSHSRQQWAAMVQKHTVAFVKNLRQTRAEIAPVFGLPEQERKPHTSEADDFWEAARKIDQMSAEINDAVRLSFTVRPQGTDVVPVKSQDFWDLVDSATAVAGNLVSHMTDQ